MNAIFVLIAGIGAMALGYLFYSKFIADKIYRLDPNFRTPAHEFEDGVDFVPTNKFVLWGHHFTSVAGAAPIIGPAIAVIWGYIFVSSCVERLLSDPKWVLQSSNPTG